ncbi:MAG TPA: cupin domain-containing protein [Nocardioides sp.]|uniref:cupin domain-containing protein n=1 Tax=Nocardioides sp. TaxID=35761 RepID=UPI002F41F380
MTDFVIREWHLSPYPGDMAPLHVHHRGDEGFIVLEGRLAVQDSGTRHVLEAGHLHIVRAGARHTFATVGEESAHVLCVMTPEIDSLIQRLHDPDVEDMAAVWAEHHSSLV